MKLRPLEGIDDLRFGDTRAKAIALFGDADEERSHPDDRCSTTLHFRKKNLSLGFSGDDRLVFIAALDGEEKVELWGDRPFEMKQAAHLRRWIERSGRRLQPHHDSFGARFEVREEGVTFCFSAEVPGHLEGVQLSPA
jgi:hypothetical protein